MLSTSRAARSPAVRWPAPRPVAVFLPGEDGRRAELLPSACTHRSVSDEWRSFMKSQIARARGYFCQAEQGAAELNQESRWPVWVSLLLYRQILDEIEANDYDNFSKRAYVPKAKKLAALPKAYLTSLKKPLTRPPLT